MDYKQIDKHTYRKKNWIDWVEEHLGIIYAGLVIVFVIVALIVILRG